MDFVVSDVHGHPEQLVTALQGASLVDHEGAWCGGQATLGVLGDLFDRGPDGIAVVDLVRRLQGEADQAGGEVCALLGNHEILALGMHLFGDRPVSSDLGGRFSFAQSWVMNGGQIRDQQGLTPAHVAWLSGLDAVIPAGPDLLLHADTTEYLRWGQEAVQINEAIHDVLAGDDIEQWWECWARLTTRYAFAGRDGEKVAADLLEVLGGERIVHGHSFISTLSRTYAIDVTGPLSYAGGRVLAIDGGIAAGGPCLVVRLDQDPPTGTV